MVMRKAEDCCVISNLELVVRDVNADPRGLERT